MSLTYLELFQPQGTQPGEFYVLRGDEEDPINYSKFLMQLDKFYSQKFDAPMWPAIDDNCLASSPKGRLFAAVFATEKAPFEKSSNATNRHSYLDIPTPGRS